MNLSDLFYALGLLTATLWTYKVVSLLYLYFFKPSSVHQYLIASPGKSSWALVTGSSDGIGLETARACLARGFNVMIHGRNEQKLSRIVDEMRKEHGNRQVHYVVADATDPTSVGNVKKAVQQIETQEGVLKLLINNVGGNIFCSRTYSSVEEMTVDEIKNTINANAVFPTLLSRALLPILQANEPSCVINIGSQAGTYGMPYCNVYAACKAFNHAFSSGLTSEIILGNRKVEVLGVVVGNVNSAGNHASKPDFMTLTSSHMARNILDRIGCGEVLLVGNWRHRVIELLMNALPEKMMRSALRDGMQKRRKEEDKTM